MRPKAMLKLDKDVHTKIATALVTRFSPLNGRKIPISVAKKFVPDGPVPQWGRVQVAEGGDKMSCRAMIKPGVIGRDCTYVRVGVVIIFYICHLTLARR
jgi:hypothetical protein